MNAKAYELIMQNKWDEAWEIEKFPGLSRKDWEDVLRRKLYDAATAMYNKERSQKYVSSNQ